MSTEMISPSDGTPDDDVIDAVANQMALCVISHEKFDSTERMGSFHTGFIRGFIEGAKFMRQFYRSREVRRFLDRNKKADASSAGLSNSKHGDDAIKPVAAPEVGEDIINIPLKDIIGYEVYWYNRDEDFGHTKKFNKFYEAVIDANKKDGDRDNTFVSLSVVYTKGDSTTKSIYPRSTWSWHDKTADPKCGKPTEIDDPGFHPSKYPDKNANQRI